MLNWDKLVKPELVDEMAALADWTHWKSIISRLVAPHSPIVQVVIVRHEEELAKVAAFFAEPPTEDADEQQKLLAEMIDENTVSISYNSDKTNGVVTETPAIIGDDLSLIPDDEEVLCIYSPPVYFVYIENINDFIPPF
jgi:hypothetical protein